eukprot:352968-Chlamydomonas_euryale.AAC.1
MKVLRYVGVDKASYLQRVKRFGGGSKGKERLEGVWRRCDIIGRCEVRLRGDSMAEGRAKQDSSAKGYQKRVTAKAPRKGTEGNSKGSQRIEANDEQTLASTRPPLTPILQLRTSAAATEPHN